MVKKPVALGDHVVIKAGKKARIHDGVTGRVTRLTGKKARILILSGNLKDEEKEFPLEDVITLPKEVT